MPRGRKTKMTADQEAYLLSLWDEFRDKQRRDQLSRFWSKMENGWFMRWPQEEVLGFPLQRAPATLDIGAPTDTGADALNKGGASNEGGPADGECDAPDEDDEPGIAKLSMEDTIRLGVATKKTKRGEVAFETLHSWYNNRSQKLKKAQGKVAQGSVAGSLAALLFNSLRKKTRRLQKIEIYQKRNKSKIDAAIAQEKAKIARWDSQNTNGDSDSDSSTTSSSSSNSDSSSDSDSSSNTDSEDGATKGDGVGRYKKKGGRGGPAKMDRKGRSAAMRLRRKVSQHLFDNETKEEKAMVEKFAINELPAIMQEFHAGVERMTGWVGVTLFGGPLPEEGGKVATKCHTSGESPAGLNLTASIPNWEELVVPATGQWLRRCYSADLTGSEAKEVRCARALVKTPPKPAQVPAPVADDPEDPAATAVPPKKGKSKGLLKPKKQTVKQIAAARAREEKRAAAAELFDSVDQPNFDGNDGGMEHEEHPFIPIDPTLCEDISTSVGPPGTPAAANPAVTNPAVPTAALGPIVSAFGVAAGISAVPFFPVPEEWETGYPPFVYPPGNPVVAPFSAPLLPLPPSTPTSSTPSSRMPVPPPAPPSSTSSSRMPAPPPAPPSSTPSSRTPTPPPTPSSSTPPLPPSSTPSSHTPVPPPAPPSSTPSSRMPTPPPTPSSSTPPLPPSSTPSSHAPAPPPPASTPSSTPVPPPSPPPPPPPSLPPPPPPSSISGTPPRHRRAEGVQGTVAPGLSQAQFPESCPMSKAPLAPAPPGGGRGRGRGWGTGRGGAGGGGEGDGGGGRPGAHANWVFRQTYKEDGTVVPLALDAPLPHQLSRAENDAIAARVRENWDADHQVKWEQQLRHNPDGPSDLFILKGRALPLASLELAPGQKRIRKPAASREMPIPLSARGTKMTKADIASAAKDAEILKKLNGKKRPPVNDENAGPSKKR
ncbi:hypothetical protein FB451DRAFT_1195497 [Mycena latifolia]|nr:hypothetical protein FB451DRAFT_1195497 [Mycena latifolia]